MDGSLNKINDIREIQKICRFIDRINGTVA
jgi:hypothetical protein